MWSEPAVIVAIVTAFLAWLGSIGALLWKMGSGTQVIIGRLDTIDVRIEGVEKEIAIGRESREKLHTRIDELGADMDAREKEHAKVDARAHAGIGERLAKIETEMRFVGRRKSSSREPGS